MTKEEMYKIVKKVYDTSIRTYDNWDNGFEYIGLRFEDKQRQYGEICEYSKHNQDRDDERDMPIFGTEEYDEMEELDGTSSWFLDLKNSWDFNPKYVNNYHAYIIASNRTGNVHYNTILDNGEIVLKDAVVLSHLY